jgi:hypothetical protein
MWVSRSSVSLLLEVACVECYLHSRCCEWYRWSVTHHVRPCMNQQLCSIHQEHSKYYPCLLSRCLLSVYGQLAGAWAVCARSCSCLVEPEITADKH